MKKILVALLVSAFGISAMAQSIVYDYKATFKRVDPQYKIRTLKESSSSYKAITESYAVKSDSITGYIALPICNSCNDSSGLTTSFDPNLFKGTAYLVRKGDKLSKKSELPFVLKTKAEAKAAIFGKDAFVIDNKPEADPQPHYRRGDVSVKGIKNSWMMLNFGNAANDFVNNWGVGVIDSIKVVPQAGGYNLKYGFMGLDNTVGFYIYNYGFGTVKLLSKADVYSMGWCGGDEVIAGKQCFIIQSISGSTIGALDYEGACTVTPMWNLCAQVDKDDLTTLAPIAGTWTLKYNKSLSNAEDQETAILNKLKVKDETKDVADATSSIPQ